MTLEELTLELTSDGYEYAITNIQGVDPNQRKEAVSVAPPGQAPAQNILLGVRGMQADLSIRFQAHDDGSDRANGTAPVGEFTNDTVITLEEQYRWLREYIHDPDFSAAWTLTHETGDLFASDQVFVERVNFPLLQQDSPRWVEVRIDLRRGQSV